MIYWLVITIVATFCISFRTHKRGLWSSHEGRAGQIARNMLADGYIVERLENGHETYQKPALYYWAICLFAKITGEVDQLSIRLPSIISAIILLSIVFWVATISFSPEIGIVSSLVLMTSMRYWWLSHVGRIDMLLTLFVIGAGFAFYYGCRSQGRQRWWLYLLGYTCMAGGCLAKGPVAIVLVACGLGPYILLKKHWREVYEVCSVWILIVAAGVILLVVGSLPLRVALVMVMFALPLALWQKFGKNIFTSPHLPGLLLLIAIALPWFILVHYATEGRFTSWFFVRHHIGRFLGQEIADFEGFKARPFWFYIPQIIVAVLPWSLLLPGVLWKSARKNFAHFDIRYFLTIWCTTTFLFLSACSYKRPDYILPLVPLLALLIGWFYTSCYDDKHNMRWVRLPITCTWIVLVIAIVMIWVFFLTAISGYPLSSLVATMTQTSWFQNHFNAKDAGGLLNLLQFFESKQQLLFLAGMCLLITVGLLLARHFRQSRNTVLAIMSLLTLLVYCTIMWKIMPYFEPLRTQANLAQQVKKIGKGGCLVLYGSEVHDLVFYLNGELEIKLYFDLYQNRDFKDALRDARGKNILFIMKSKYYYRCKNELPSYVTVVAENIAGHLTPHVVLASR